MNIIPHEQVRFELAIRRVIEVMHLFYAEDAEYARELSLQLRKRLTVLRGRRQASEWEGDR